MPCPFFKEDYIGFCSASNFPYTPAIGEMEQQCFSDSFDSCANFSNLLATEHNSMDEFNILKST